MNLKTALNLGVTVAALLIAACGTSGAPTYGASTSPLPSGAAGSPAGAPQPAGTATVSLRSSALGQILVDGNGKTLYLFEADKAGMSSCNGDCAAVWPPLIASGTPVAGPGINQALLTTTKRNDGSAEVVYNGHPLYYFVSDKQAGDATGQGISSFGADWYVLSATGTKVDKG